MNIFQGVEKVLVLGAHGDDEIIGCGGTIANLVRQGTEVIVITFTKRVSSGYAKVISSAVAENIASKEMQAADDILGVKREVLGYPVQGVQNDIETFQKVTKLIRQYRPDIILTHRPNDHHRDHRAVSLIADEARWKAWENINPHWGEPWETKWVLHFEIFDLIEKPHIISLFDEHCLDKKLKAMTSQVSQTESFDYEGYIRALVLVRGAFGGRKCYGEAFFISNFHSTIVH